MNKRIKNINFTTKNAFKIKKAILVYTAVMAIIISTFSMFSLGLSVQAAENVNNPRVFMPNYIINDGTTQSVSPGIFTLNYTLLNPSLVGIEDVFLSFDQKTAQIIPVDGNSNVNYIGGIGAGGENKGKIELYIPKSATAGICKLDFYASYNSSDPSVNNLLNSTFSIYINIENNTELALKKVELLDETSSGGKKRLVVEYENPGVIDFKNLSLVLDGNIIAQQKIQSLPILKAGKSNSIEYYVQFTEIGDQRLSVHISYEDDSGEVYKTPITTKKTTVIDNGTPTITDSSTQSGGYITRILNRIIKFAKTTEFIILIILFIILATLFMITLPKIKNEAKKKNWYYKNNDNNYKNDKNNMNYKNDKNNKNDKNEKNEKNDNNDKNNKNDKNDG